MLEASTRWVRYNLEAMSINADIIVDLHFYYLYGFAETAVINPDDISPPW
jgi:hypothetical protein